MSMYNRTMTHERGKAGRPRSDQAREAVLQAVDDLLLEEGYAAMTMKGIAERARVSRQTVYRWWSTKAEILFEASVNDAELELAIDPSGDLLIDLTLYVRALARFLASSPAGAAYRALLGEAQHDAAVARMLASRDVLGESAQMVIGRAVEANGSAFEADFAAALLVGPTFFWVLSGRDATRIDAQRLAETFLQTLQGQSSR